MERLESELDDGPTLKARLRSAAWRGGWTVIGVQCLLLFVAAVLFPLFAKAKGGPGKLGVYVDVAHGIQRAQIIDHRWPRSANEVGKHFAPRYRSTSYDVALESDDFATAVYAITVDGRTRRFRVPAAQLQNPVLVPPKA